MLDSLKRRAFSVDVIKEAWTIHSKRLQAAQKESALVLGKNEFDLIEQVNFGEELPVEVVKDDDSISCDIEAVNMVLSLLEDGVSPRQCALFGISSSNPSESELEKSLEANLQGFAQRWLQSGFMSKKALYELDGKMTVGDKVLDQITAPNAVDEMEQAEQVRLQVMEFEAFGAGMPIPVSPRDNHRIHCGIIKGLIEPLLASSMQMPEPKNIDKIIDALGHLQMHLQMWEQMEPEAAQDIAQFGEFLKAASQAAQQAQKAAVAQAAAMGQQLGQMVAQGQQAQMPQAPGAQPQPQQALPAPQPDANAAGALTEGLPFNPEVTPL
jgi:hypothetical protein